jgi:hypothetical protein
MGELLPIVSGLLLGSALGLLRPAMRVGVGTPLAILLGATATVVTGESELSWAFVLIDIPMVALCSVVGLRSARWFALRRRRHSVADSA